MVFGKKEKRRLSFGLLSFAVAESVEAVEEFKSHQLSLTLFEMAELRINLFFPVCNI